MQRLYHFIEHFILTTCFSSFAQLILNKCDLEKDEEKLKEIEGRLRKINPQAPILRTENSKIAPSDLINQGCFDLKRVLDFEPDFLEDINAEHEHDSSIVSTSSKIEGEVNVSMMERWVQRLIVEDGANLYRYKGIVAVKGKDEKFVFQGVGMMFSGAFQGKWAPGEKRESRFVFIGKNLDIPFLKEGFRACIDDGTLRFEVGQTVECNFGNWEECEVIKQWDEGNAYRVKQKRTGVEGWAPIDVDAYIRPKMG